MELQFTGMREMGLYLHELSEDETSEISEFIVWQYDNGDVVLVQDDDEYPLDADEPPAAQSRAGLAVPVMKSIRSMSEAELDCWRFALQRQQSNLLGEIDQAIERVIVLYAEGRGAVPDLRRTLTDLSRSRESVCSLKAYIQVIGAELAARHEEDATR